MIKQAMQNLLEKQNNQSGKKGQKLLKDITTESYGKRLWNRRKKDVGVWISLAAILSMAIFTGSVFRYEVETKKEQVAYWERTKGVAVYYEGKFIGNMRDAEKVSVLISKLQNELSAKYGAKAVFGQDIQMKDTHFEDTYKSTDSMFYNTLKDNISIQVEVAGIFVNGKEVVRLHDEVEANTLLEQLKNGDFQGQEGVELLSSEFVESVEVKKVKTAIHQIQDIETAKLILQKGTDEVKTHVVEPGEVMSKIASEYGVTLSDIEQANPGIEVAKIFPGDEINLIVPKPYLSVRNIIRKEYTENNMPYEKIYKDSGSYYKDEEFVAVKGENGVSELVCEIAMVNGVEESRNILSEKVIKTPKEAIVVRGTKNIPELKGTGRFSLPTAGKLTSKFGYRGREFHTGVDLASKTGTPIKAADGGVVIFAGYNGNYGYMIDIDHGGGFVTRYAHCSALYVKKGDKVYKDKTIGAVGSTGRSSGPHVHFEVRKYDNPVNPYGYIGKNYR